MLPNPNAKDEQSFKEWTLIVNNLIIGYHDYIQSYQHAAVQHDVLACCLVAQLRETGKFISAVNV